MHRLRPWVVGGARGAVALVVGGVLSAPAVPPDRSGVRLGRAVVVGLRAPSRAAGWEAVPAPAAAAEPAQPPPSPPPPPVVWPGAGEVTGWFGERRATHRHRGLDIHASTGTRVVAAAAGTVRHAGPAPAGFAGYGTVVVIGHEGGISTVYAHLSGVVVRRGQAVSPGQQVGAAGSTGQVDAPHLHFEVRRNGTPVDPRGWLPPR